ncbi:chaperonin 10-like protein [Lasiosphaeris hirsuta]|uniref:Chaperonin 10-like protein n=1 Tax=Lasiosphaeris hirsuta TaxID=260670 RepID=A0AA40A7Q8_9PEZI|nr:chaperonin 10-like protein [Lasiosphaeris hirsuta]
MTTQSGITIAGPNAPYTVVDNIPRPTPGPSQALVKSLYVGLNPVQVAFPSLATTKSNIFNREPFMQHTGLLIDEFPAVLGSDVSGIVLEVGADCKKLSKGDYVFGCVPIGRNQLSPFQETFLVEEDWIFKKPENVGLEEACTIGAAVLTAGLALVDGQNITLPAPGTQAESKDSWVVVMGGSGSVGQYACQLASLAGYKVLASSSPSKTNIPLDFGAVGTFNNRAPLDEQLVAIGAITGGKFGHIFDASIVSFELSIKAFEELSTETKKYFSTADDWSDISVPESISLYRVMLGQLGKVDTPRGKHITDLVVELTRKYEQYLELGELKALDYELLPGVGWSGVVNGIADYEAGKLSKKAVVKVQDE